MIEHHLHRLLLLNGDRICLPVVSTGLVLVVDLLLHLLLLRNTLWLAIVVQDVVRLWVGADEGAILHSGKAEARKGGKVEVAKVGEDNLEDGDEEAEDWDWEEVDVLVP